MIYTKYFGLVTKEQGQINLPQDQFQRMMNIVHLEGVILGLNKAKETFKDTNLYYKYDIIILDNATKLSALTGNIPPNLLLKEMVRYSD
ncbi:MAG: hypothetical protein GZ086_12005 [Gelidibacter sp.]|nr:hypothetical protein [Gelidibacter sp.]